MRHKVLKYRYLLILSLFSLILVVSCSAGAKPSPQIGSTQKLNVELPGTNSHAIPIDNTGRLLESAQIISGDGNISLAFDKGTKLADRKGEPLHFIKVTLDTAAPMAPQDTRNAGITVDIQPAEAAANPALKLTLDYNPNAIPQGLNNGDVWIYNYNAGKWDMMQYRQVDTRSNRITTSITRLGKYTVIAPVKPVEIPTPTSQPALTSLTFQEALSNGKPTLAEFGSDTCIPCQQMKPILEQLSVDYRDKLNVVIIDVYEQQSLANYFKIMAIPTQIIFDSKGQEVTRHMGLWPMDQILTQLNRSGIQ
jgi:thioredoxin 1